MAARSFPLAAVLAFREQKEAAEERALAASTARVAEARRSLAQIQAVLDGLGPSGAVASGAASAAVLQERDLRWKALREARSQMQQELDRREAERAAQQQRYVAARCDREMLTELRAKQRAAMQAARDKDEQRRTDDLFTGRHARR